MGILECFQIRIELPDLITHLRKLLPVLIVQGQRFVYQPLGMYPAQCMLQNVELSGIITHDHQIIAKSVAQQTTEQRPFCSIPNIAFAVDVN